VRRETNKTFYIGKFMIINKLIQLYKHYKEAEREEAAFIENQYKIKAHYFK